MAKIRQKIQKAELSSPAGSFSSLMAAIKAGADSIYFGVQLLNMRIRRAENFRLNDLGRISKICKKNKVKSYITVNTIIYDKDIGLMKKICNAAKKAGIDAVIASDISAISYANSIGVPVHISTQANISNIDAVKFYAKYADAVILARELSLEQIKLICNEIKKQNIRGHSGKLVKVEVFAHGALCVSIAGKCYMSLANYNASANRGLCLQSCRRTYRVIDEETGDELKIENKYIMSPKDLCTIGFIDKLIEAGVSILKIEGRGRTPDYVYITTKAYREAIDSHYDGTYKGKANSKEKIENWTKQLEAVFNRGFWHGGYYLGKRLGEWSGAYGSKAAKKKIFAGIVRNYFAKKKIALVLLQAGSLKIGDDILITGLTTGVVYDKVKSIFNKDDKPVNTAKKGELVTVPVKEKVRRNDKVYCLKNI